MFMSSPLKAMQANNSEITSARREKTRIKKKIKKKIPSFMTKIVGVNSQVFFLESIAGRCFPHF